MDMRQGPFSPGLVMPTAAGINYLKMPMQLGPNGELIPTSIHTSMSNNTGHHHQPIIMEPFASQAYHNTQQHQHHHHQVHQSVQTNRHSSQHSSQQYSRPTGHPHIREEMRPKEVITPLAPTKSLDLEAS